MKRIIIFLLLASASGLRAQSVSAGITAGKSQYDLSGTGTASFVAGFIDVVPVRPLVVEASIEYFRYRTDFEAPRRHILPEVMVQAEIPWQTVRPYLGAGAGLSIASRNAGTELTLSAAGGVRIVTRSRFSFRGELRIRSIDPWTGTMADWGAGISYRL